MATIAPFRGIHYNAKPGDDITSRLSPPYDVLSEDDKNSMLTSDPHNIVAIDMPFYPPGYAGPDDAYQHAADLLQQWLNEGVLTREDSPAIYPYQQTYTHEGRSYTRRGFIARLKLEQFGAGSVYPHEQTFPGPIEDRMKLMQYTSANTSQVFMLFSDPGNTITDSLYANVDTRPHLSGKLADVTHEAWIINEQSVIDTLVKQMSDRNVFIADGHHRYTTGLYYRDWATEQNGGNLPADHAAQYICVVFVAMEDPGLFVGPTHRVVDSVPGFDLDTYISHVKPYFTTEPLTNADDLQDQIDNRTEGTIGVYDAASCKGVWLTPTDNNPLDTLEPQRSRAWRELPTAMLHRYLLDEVLVPEFCKGETPKLTFPHEAGHAISQAEQKQHNVVFLLQHTKVHDVKAVCESGDLMPQKSTFFYPKLATGMVINALD